MKIAIVQPNYTIGSLENNYLKNILFIDRAKQNGCDLIIFPEMAISGYPPLDLIDDKEFMDKQYHFIDKLSSYSNDDIGIIFGAIMPNKSNIGKNKYNAGIFATGGGHKSIAVKNLLPTYNIFDEARYFEPGKDSCIIEYKGMKFGVLICEDIWAEENNIYNNNPIEKLFRRNDINDRNIDFIVSINASPSEEYKLFKRRNMLARLSYKYNTSIIYVNQVGGNDDIIFDGNSMVYDSKGHRQITLSSFAEDYKEIVIHNKDNKIDIDIIGDGIEFHPHVELEDGKINSIELYYNHIVLGIKDYTSKCGFDKVVIGESGGIDSALTTALAVDAIGSDNVIAITMPSEYSSEGSWKDSEILCKNLNVKLYKHEIKNIYNNYTHDFEQIFGKNKNKLTKENLQARIRANILMEYSNEFQALLLSTSNKSESSVGYTTYLGDMSGGLAPLGDIYKTEVWELSKWYNDTKHKGKELIPNIIINKEPSAELSPNQKDTDSLPPYQLLDIILKVYIEGYLLDKKELDKLNKILYNVPVNEIKRILNMVDRAEFKRRQAPINIRCHRRSFGSGRRLPIVQKFEREGKL
jgi:NAD+ synthetase